MRYRFIIYICFLYLSLLPTAAQRNKYDVITTDNLESVVEIGRWEAINAGFVAATFSPDGQTIAIALNNQTIQLLSVETQETIMILNGADIDGFILSFKPDASELLLSDRGGGYILWDVQSGERLVEHRPSEQVYSTASEDLSAYYYQPVSHKVVTVYDMYTGNDRVQLPISDVAPRPVLSSNGDVILINSESEQIGVWDTNTGDLLAVLEQPEYLPEGIIGDLVGHGFTPNEEIWGSWQAYLPGERVNPKSIIQFWNSTTFEPTLFLNGGNVYFRLAFDPSNNFLIASGQDAYNLTDGTWIWNLDEPQEQEVIAVPGGHLVTFSPNAQFIVIGSGTTTFVVLHPTNDLTTTYRLNVLGTYVPPEISSDGRFILTTGQDIRLWGVPSTEE